MVVAGGMLLGSGESDNCEKDDALHDDDCNKGRGKNVNKVCTPVWGAGIAQWLKRRTRD